MVKKVALVVLVLVGVGASVGLAIYYSFGWEKDMFILTAASVVPVLLTFAVLHALEGQRPRNRQLLVLVIIAGVLVEVVSLVVASLLLREGS